ncbi:MAG: DUF3800 domain-containing protein [Chloroflexota bacterium]|nr:DUF3800 domain-containing protein [Chloroflexota bacterium]
MHLAYVDESGDPGANGTNTYSLACLLVSESSWLAALDALVSFRRFVKTHFGVPVSHELKATYLIGNRGPWLSKHPLPDGMRHDLYRQAMRIQPKLDLRTFAVVIDKPRLAQRDPALNSAEVAWEYLIQRLERFSTKSNSFVSLIHDEGDGGLIRKLARKARRIGTAGSQFGTGSLSVPFHRLLDDPSPRDSRDSYLLQLADLSAYAAYRRIYPPPPKIVNIVPQTMWDELGTAKHLAANTRGGAEAIVHWPRR